jgi:hypothetical protein
VGLWKFLFWSVFLAVGLLWGVSGDAESCNVGFGEGLGFVGELVLAMVGRGGFWGFRENSRGFEFVGLWIEPGFGAGMVFVDFSSGFMPMRELEFSIAFFLDPIFLVVESFAGVWIVWRKRSSFSSRALL